MILCIYVCRISIEILYVLDTLFICSCSLSMCPPTAVIKLIDALLLLQNYRLKLRYEAIVCDTLCNVMLIMLRT